MNSDKLISVIFPVYNGSKFLKDALSSILNQTYADFEILLLDDGSTDNSPDIIAEIKDDRIQIFRDSHRGLVYQLNKGVSHAKGRYIARMDADDYSFPRRFEYEIDYLKNNEEIGLTGTNFIHIDENGSILEKKRMPESHQEIEYMMPVTTSVLHSTIMTYKSLLMDTPYDESITHSEDHTLFLQLMRKGIKMHNIQQYLFKYRIWKGSAAYSKRDIQKKNVYNEGLKYITEMYSDPSALFEYNLRRGILEYYRGSMSKSRKHLVEAFKINHTKWKSILRYLPLTLLGDPIVKMLRESDFLPMVSRGVNRLTGKDYNIIKKEENKNDI